MKVEEASKERIKERVLEVGCVSPLEEWNELLKYLEEMEDPLENQGCISQEISLYPYLVKTLLFELLRKGDTWYLNN